MVFGMTFEIVPVVPSQETREVVGAVSGPGKASLWLGR